MAETLNEVATARMGRVPQIDGIEYIELFVGNAQQAAHFYRWMFGFTPVAYAGPETGVRDRVSFVVQQGNIRLMLTSAVDPDHPIAEHLKLHGDGVKDIALTVQDAAHIFAETVRQGARPIAEPAQVEYPGGCLTRATVGLYGDTVHSFIQREHTNGTGAFLPGFQPLKIAPAASTGLTEIDHLAICLDRGSMNEWVDFYKQALGFTQLHEEVIETEYSAMNSKAVQGADGRIKFVLIEPASSKRKSQIEEYLSSYHGAGVQHIALLSEDIVTTIRVLQENGIDFRRTPAAYYDKLTDWVGAIDADVEALRELNILADRDQWGHLLQIFAKPAQSRPTLFCEIIQRNGARGFGSGNIKALFESIEREQLLHKTA